MSLQCSPPFQSGRTQIQKQGTQRHQSVKGQRERRCHSQSRRSSSHSGRPSYVNWTSSSNLGVLLDQEVATAFPVSAPRERHSMDFKTLHFSISSMQRAVWNTDRSLTTRLSGRTCMEWQYWRYVEMPWALSHHERKSKSSHRTGPPRVAV